LNQRGQQPPLAIPPAAAWAAGDLVLAVEQGVLTPAELQLGDLQQPAPRHRVWQLLARALKIPLDAGDSLEFKDAARIPAPARPAAATLTRLGLLQGFPDGTLRPLDTITRAEMLALLSRMVEDGWLNPAPDRRLEGWVQAVKPDSGRARAPAPAAASVSMLAATPARYLITLSTPQTGSKDYPLAANAALFGTPLPGPHGLYNRHVLAVLNKRGEIAFVRVYEPRPQIQTTVNTGSIEKVVQGRSLQVVIRDRDHDLLTYATGWATAVPEGGTRALKTGQWVRVALREDTIWQLDALEVKKVAGKVKSITDRRLYLEKFDKTLGNLFLDWERARLADKDGQPYSGSGLKPGASVEITCLDWDEVLEIKVR
jgi:hypothetical protein